MSHWVKCSGFGCDNDADGHGHYYADYPGGGGGGAGWVGNNRRARM